MGRRPFGGRYRKDLFRRGHVTGPERVKSQRLHPYDLQGRDLDQGEVTVTVIPGREPTRSREARPDDRLRERTRNPESRNTFGNFVCIPVPALTRRPGMTTADVVVTGLVPVIPLRDT